MPATLENTRFYLDRNESSVDVWQFAGGMAAVYSRKNPFKEGNNEDAAVLIPIDDLTGVMAVADGCGGTAGGDRAARLAVQQLANSLKKSSEKDVSLRSAILDGIESANRKVCELGIGAATTVAAVEIDKVMVRPYHVGDSGVLLIGNRGKVKLKTQSHSPVGYAVQAGVLNEADALHHEDRHIVSNVVGSADTHIEIGTRRKMALRDTLVVASDGLFDNVHLNEIIEITRKGPIEKALTTLAAVVESRMSQPANNTPSKPDDLSIVLFRRNSS